MNKQGALLIFAKAPVAGQVKTRLIPDIGQEKALILYKEFLSRTLNTTAETGFSEIQLWISGNINNEYFVNLKNKDRFNLFQQTGEDLGQRMFNAFESVLNKYSYAVLIGSDCPELLSSDIDAAGYYLENGKDLVLGPATDGGYYLIGLKKNNSMLFSGIEWGKENVFSETYACAKKMNLEVGLLPERSDVDVVSDLSAYIKMKKQEAIL
jgi:uncharacterized protein